MHLLADDARLLDQLPAEAWNFGPLFVLALFLSLSLVGLIWYAVRRFDKHMGEMIVMFRTHLQKNEATDHEMLLTLAKVEIRLQSQICKVPNGNGNTIQPGR